MLHTFPAAVYSFLLHTSAYITLARVARESAFFSDGGKSGMLGPSVYRCLAIRVHYTPERSELRERTIGFRGSGVLSICPTA